MARLASIVRSAMLLSTSVKCACVDSLNWRYLSVGMDATRIFGCDTFLQNINIQWSLDYPNSLGPEGVG